MDEFYRYSMYKYMSNYTDDEFYRTYEDIVGEYPETINIKVVNTAYAHYGNGRINWLWSEVLGEVMATLSSKRQAVTQQELAELREQIYEYEFEHGFPADTLDEDAEWLQLQLAEYADSSDDDESNESELEEYEENAVDTMETEGQLPPKPSTNELEQIEDVVGSL